MFKFKSCSACEKGDDALTLFLTAEVALSVLCAASFSISTAVRAVRKTLELDQATSLALTEKLPPWTAWLDG